MTDAEIKEQFISIQKETEKINESLSTLLTEQIKCNAENSAILGSINNHLGRLNNSVAKHEVKIRGLEDFKIVYESIENIKTEYKNEAKINRRLIYAALLGLVVSIVINFVFV